MDLNVAIVSHPPRDEEEMRRQAIILADQKDALQSIGLCFQILLTPTLPPPNPFMRPDLQAIFLCGNDLRHLFDSDSPNFVLYEIIRRQVPVHRLCPYDTTHEARGAMFFGRQKELSRLVEESETSFMVSGARRIGKTSLLIRARNALRARGEFRTRAFYFNCLTWGGYRDCFRWIAHGMAPKAEIRIDKGVRNITYLLERQSRHGSKTIWMFFDEVDRVVELDAEAGWPLFRVLKTATSEGCIRPVFAGFRSVSHLNRRDSPFYEALLPLTLQPLKKSETEQLVAIPLRSAGVTIQSESRVLERIWNGSQGQPFVVQFYAQQIYNLACGREPQEAGPADIDTIENDADVSAFLLEHFLENTISSASPVKSERLCALLLANKETSIEWTEGEFLAACRDCGHPLEMDEVHDALRNLLHANVLSCTSYRYRFALPLLRDALRKAFPNLGVIVDSLDRRP